MADKNPARSIWIKHVCTVSHTAQSCVHKCNFLPLSKKFSFFKKAGAIWWYLIVIYEIYMGIYAKQNFSSSAPQ